VTLVLSVDGSPATASSATPAAGTQPRLSYGRSTCSSMQYLVGWAEVADDAVSTPDGTSLDCC